MRMHMIIYTHVNSYSYIRFIFCDGCGLVNKQDSWRKKIMKKQTITVFGNQHFLLGVRKEDNKKVWLEDFEWQCDWYWGGGYLHTFTNEANPTASRDIAEHYHLSDLKADKNLYDAIKEHLKEITLSDARLWLFCDLMSSFYTLKEAAGVIGRGGSHYTTNDVLGEDKERAKYINEELIGNKLIPAIKDLLQG